MSRLPKALRTASLLGVSVAASLAIGECALRLVRPQPLGFYWLSPEGLPLHVPNRAVTFQREDFRAEVRINSLGFRGDEFAIPKPPGTYRILALGDSFTEGMQVDDDETFAARMAQELSTAERPVDVLNLGVSGYGTADALALLRVYGPRLEPDLVLLFFCLANDVPNNAASTLCRQDGDRMVCGLPERPTPRRLAIAQVRSQIAVRSHLYQILRAATTHPVFQQIGLRAPTVEQTTAEMPFGRDQYREPPPAYMMRALDTTRAMLRELRDFAATLGSETWVVLVPVREQIWDREWNDILAVDARPETLHRDRLQRAVGAVAREAGLPVVDLYGAFRAHNGAAETLFWKIDAHYDAAGHELTASEVNAALRVRGLPPAPGP